MEDRHKFRQGSDSDANGGAEIIHSFVRSLLRSFPRSFALSLVCSLSFLAYSLIFWPIRWFFIWFVGFPARSFGFSFVFKALNGLPARRDGGASKYSSSWEGEV